MSKWIVSKELLENTVALIDSVPVRNGIKSSEFIRISKLGKDSAVFSLTSDMAAKAIVHTGEEYPFEDEMFLDRRIFIPFVNKGKESQAKDYMFIEKGEQIILKHGGRRAEYAKAKDITGYEDPKKLEDASIVAIGRKWTSLVDCAENCATPDPITPSLNCVHICQTGKYIEVMSSDSYIIFYGKAESDKKPIKGSIAFPLLLTAVLKQDGAHRVLWTDKLAVVEFPKGKVWQAVKTAARKDFPEKEIRKHVKEMEAAPIGCIIQSNVFCKAVDRIASYVSPLGLDDHMLEIKTEKGSKRITVVSGPEESRFTETIHGLTKSKGDFVFEWPLAQVLPVILYSTDEGQVKFHLAKSGVSAFATKNIMLVVPKRSK